MALLGMPIPNAHSSKKRSAATSENWAPTDGAYTSYAAPEIGIGREFTEEDQKVYQYDEL
jgi:hypothetical protein